MSKLIDDAWELVKDVKTPEAEALRALFGSSAYKHAQNMDVDTTYDWLVEAVQERIAQKYLFARSAPTDAGENEA